MDELSKIMSALVLPEEERSLFMTAINEHAHILDRIEAWVGLYELSRVNGSLTKADAAVQAIKLLCETEKD